MSIDVSHLMRTQRQKLRAVVISLPGASARRATVEQSFSANPSLDWTFFDAANAATPTSVESDVSLQTRRFGRPLTNGEIGCFKSHFCVLQQFSEREESDWLLVAEDDTIVDPLFDFSEVVKLAEEHRIGYLRLYARKIVRFQAVANVGSRQLVRFLTDPYGTQAYLISRRSALKFLATVKAISCPVDDELGRFWINGLVPYALFPFPLLELASPSSLEQDRQLINQQQRNRSLSRLVFRLTEKLSKESSNLKLALRQP